MQTPTNNPDLIHKIALDINQEAELRVKRLGTNFQNEVDNILSDGNFEEFNRNYKQEYFELLQSIENQENQNNKRRIRENRIMLLSGIVFLGSIEETIESYLNDEELHDHFYKNDAFMKTIESCLVNFTTYESSLDNFDFMFKYLENNYGKLDSERILAISKNFFDSKKSDIESK